MLQKSNIYQKTQGFTIIEVMIVLAIAAMIMMIVFLAVPTLQRSSRNTSRGTDIGAIGAAVDNYISDNGGALPTGLANDTVNPNVLLVGVLNNFYGTPTQGSFETLALNYYKIDTGNELVGGQMWYADGFGAQANVLTMKNNIFIVALKSTATNVSTPAVISDAGVPTLPTGTGGPGSGGSINAESVSIIPGETCDSTNTAAGTLNPGAVAIFYVLENGAGNGNLECLEGT
jgi:prepilin-type N-terminal cleavage/methylation domain-containing protein